MPHIPATQINEFNAAPSRGSQENAVWRIVVSPGTLPAPHQITREEIFLVTSGSAVAVIGEEKHEIEGGSVLTVPANTEFSLANPGSYPFEAIVVMPVGGQAVVGRESPFTPPWAI